MYTAKVNISRTSANLHIAVAALLQANVAASGAGFKRPGDFLRLDVP